MIDTLIRGGQVVTPWGVGDWDVAIQGEKIAAIAEKESLTDDIGLLIDATGKIVVPGGIEPHAHIAAPIALSDLETAPPDQVSRAALFGGTTTLTDFAIQHKTADVFQSIEERTSRWKGNSYCDYSHHIMLLASIPDQVMGQMKEAIEQGFPTFKLFTTNIRPKAGDPNLERRMVRMGHMQAVMELAVAKGGLLFIHAEDDDIVQYMYQRLETEERTEWFNMHEVHNNLSEELSFRRVINLAEWTGAATYFVHVSAKEGLNAIREARSKNLPIYGETLHNYLSFNAENYKEHDGMKYHTYPSLKSEEDRLALWDGVINDGINTMATDEYCTDYKIKTMGRTIADVTGGHSGAETRMGITFTEGVAKQGMSLQRFVDVTSANAARIMGYYPRKGAIMPGSDADIVLIDPDISKVLSMDDLHAATDYSIWEGWQIQGWPVTTILRGQVVVDNGQFSGKPGRGQLIPRKIGQDILNKPAC